MDARNLPRINGRHLPEPTLKVIGHLVLVDALINQDLVDVTGAQSTNDGSGTASFRERCEKVDQIIVLPWMKS